VLSPVEVVVPLVTPVPTPVVETADVVEAACETLGVVLTAGEEEDELLVPSVEEVVELGSDKPPVMVTGLTSKEKGRISERKVSVLAIEKGWEVTHVASMVPVTLQVTVNGSSPG